ncbi:MAG TPA: hypothetical protein PLL14_11330, partial [Accumulibacter sp.]|nr:hypothetical protein [Accumulibacter sp.]
LMIPGNHDYSGPGRADALHVFDACENVTVARGVGFGGPVGVRVLCVPWLYTDKSFDEVVLDAASVPCDLLLAHVQVRGALQNRRHAMEFGQPMKPYEPRPGDWSTTREFLASLPVRHFALGDFHMRQDLTDGRGGYVGALRQLDFGEEGNPAGFEIWDSESNLTEWIELDECPQHRTIIARPGESVALLDDCIKYRVRYDGAPDPLEARELEAQGVQVEAIVERRERVKRCNVPSGMVGDLPATLRFWAEQQTDEVDVDRALAALKLIDSDDLVPAEAMDEQAQTMAEAGVEGVTQGVTAAVDQAFAATGTDDDESLPF